MKLRVLLQGLTDFEIRGDQDVAIRDICYHSGQVQKGSLFVAIPGTRHDGREHIPGAVARGAAAILFEGPFFDNLMIPQIRVSGARLALARVAAAFFNHPSRGLYLAGVTGTNGKTTLTFLMEALWEKAGYRAGLIGTIAIRYPGYEMSSGQTTPESRDLQTHFDQMLKQGVDRVCMEVSSHALNQQRVTGCDFDAAVFTNLSQDHLDYHGDFAHYYAAKKQLFTQHLLDSGKSNRLALINQDDAYGRSLIEEIDPSIPCLSYGLTDRAQSYPLYYQTSIEGTTAELHTTGGTLSVQLPYLGAFNLANVIAAIELGFHSGLDREKLLEGLNNLPIVPGRLERVKPPWTPHVFVDYAHTPDALGKVLAALQPLTEGRLIVVFGCGGDRDRTKRPMMGLEAGQYGDIVIITSDNPRTEDPEQIIAEILPGVQQSGLRQSGLRQSGSRRSAGTNSPVEREYWVEVDRRKALELALELAGDRDVILVAGKGHEDYQIIGNQKFPFSDKTILEGLMK